VAGSILQRIAGDGLVHRVRAALAARLQQSPRRVFALLSDAECDEGSTGKPCCFAAHHRLSNLIALVDVNGQQAYGYTRDILDLSPLEARWQAFGWDVRSVNGHDADAMKKKTIDALDTQQGRRTSWLRRHLRQRRFVHGRADQVALLAAE